jgi:hypothetical protein
MKLNKLGLPRGRKKVEIVMFGSVSIWAYFTFGEKGGIIGR